jgi:hypothetical protein
MEIFKMYRCEILESFNIWVLWSHANINTNMAPVRTIAVRVLCVPFHSNLVHSTLGSTSSQDLPAAVSRFIWTQTVAVKAAGNQHVNTNFEVTFRISNSGVIHYRSTGNNWALLHSWAYCNGPVQHLAQMFNKHVHSSEYNAMALKPSLQLQRNSYRRAFEGSACSNKGRLSK